MEQKHRSEFPEKELWDLTALYQDREDFLRAIEKTREDINQFSRDYKGNLHTFEEFEKAFAELEQIYIQMSHIGNYAFMPQTTDYSNEEFANIAQAG
ncbi:oligoendopeptidase F, partial [Streptococcus sp. GMD6S]